MCYIGTGIDACIKKIAEEDIQVIKFVRKSEKDDVFNALYYDFKYEIGKEYDTKMEALSDAEKPMIQVTEGFHSYRRTITSFKLYGTNYYKQKYVCTSCGTNKRYWVAGMDYKLDCIIPKGSSYYMNESGEVVSDRIRILSAVEVDKVLN